MSLITGDNIHFDTKVLSRKWVQELDRTNHIIKLYKLGFTSQNKLWWPRHVTREGAAGTWTRAGTGCSPTCWPTPAPPRPGTPGTRGRPALEIWRFWWLMLPLDVTGLNASASGIVVLVPIEIWSSVAVSEWETENLSFALIPQRSSSKFACCHCTVSSRYLHLQFSTVHIDTSYIYGYLHIDIDNTKYWRKTISVWPSVLDTVQWQ